MFNSVIVKHFNNPQNIGELDNPDHIIKIGNPVCDDQVKMHIQLGVSNDVIDVKYLAYGCATSIATASIFSSYIKGKSIVEIKNLVAKDRHEMLGELEPSQYHCLEILDSLFADIACLKVS